jgi:hypothetical protein
MAIFETATGKFVLAVAKGLAKYAAGNTVTGVLAPAVMDLAWDSGAELSGSHDDERISAVGVQVATRLTAYIKAEHPKISENMIRIVSGEVAQTLRDGKISANLLVHLGLQPSRLIQHLHGTRDLKKFLREPEYELYQKILSDVADEITEISAQLVGFESAAFAATFAKQDSILSMVERIVSARSVDARKYESKYKAELQRKLNRLDLLGIRRADRYQRSQDLSISYISLTATHSVPLMGNSPAHRVRVSREPQFPAGNLEGYNPTGEIAIDQLLSSHRRIVVRGEAGSGKTTLLQWVAVRSAVGDWSDLLSSWKASVPFFVRLRECVETGFPPPEAFPALVAPISAGTMPKGWVHEQLESGRAVLLIDGVDELPSRKREGMLVHLSELVEAYPLARYVVTSRPAPVSTDSWPEWQNWIEQKSFVDISLQPMDSIRIENLIRQWHIAVADTLTDNEEREETLALPSNLVRLLRARPSIRRLATSPLLCAMICALHRERKQRLPSDRLKLYEECCDMLLSARDEVRHIDATPDYPQLTDSQKLAVVQSFAYWMITNGWSEVEERDAEEQIARTLKNLNVAPDVTGYDVRRYMVERTNLLREPVHGRIDFRHRTFEEFLAAQAAIKNGDVGVLVKNAADDQWREVIVLAAGLARPRECERLLNGLLLRGSKLKVKKHHYYLLAMACLETTVELSSEVRDAVIRAASEFFPPKSLEDAVQVARAGSPVIPLLMSNEELPSDQAAASVKALGLIGTDEALGAIETFADDTRGLVQREIGFAWDEFDTAEYARRVLSKQKSLSIRELSTWDGFQHVPQITRIIVNLIRIADRPCPYPLPELENFHVFGCMGPYSFAYLSAFPNLKTVTVWWQSSRTDLGPLADITSLQGLSIGSFDRVSELTPISTLPHLKRLELHYCTGIHDFSSLQDALSLREFKIASMHGVFPGLPPMGNLDTLTIETAIVSDLSFVEHCNKLSTLLLDDCRGIHDVRPLLRSNIQRLELMNTPVTKRNLELLKNNIPHVTVERYSGRE